MLPQSLPCRGSCLAFVVMIVCGAACSSDLRAEPPRLGIKVADVPGGKRIVAVEDDAPIREKLRVGDVIVSAKAATEGTRFRKGRPLGLADVRVSLADGQNVSVRVKRPTNPAAPSDYVQLEIELEPSDLYVHVGAAAPRYKSTRPYLYAPTDEEAAVAEEAEAIPVDEAPGGIVTVQLFFATDRALKDGKYTGTRDLTPDGPIKFGTCEVSIPPDHRIGELEGPKWWRFEFSPNPFRHVVLQKISPHSEARFFELLSQALARESADVKRALVFIHGYNVDFDEAARRTAQIHYDLNFPGVSMFYSWPSNGSVSGYISDAADIEWSTPNIEKFLASIEARPDVDEMYVVGHSMGNRGLTKALLSLADKGQGKKIKEVILAAPDVDAVVFERDIAAPLAGAFERTTIYASANDRALMASNTAAQIQRAGEIIDGYPTISSRDRIDLIDASSIDTSFMGHSYYGDEDSLIADMFNLMRNRQPANNRARLRPIVWTKGTFYRFAR